MKNTRSTAARLAANGVAVATFGTQLHNYTRGAEFSDTILRMYRSGQWRDYRFAHDRVQWRACEFDYFLIANAAPYRDVSRMLAWYRIGTELAPAMDTNAPASKRRPFTEAAAAWPGDTGETLLDRARRLGWTATPTAAPSSPVSHYARVVSREAPPPGTHARHYRTRSVLAHLDPARRRALEAEISRLRSRYTIEELRYVRERLVPAGAEGRPRGNHAQWRRDIATSNGDLGALAARWGVSRKAAQMRRERLREQN